VHWILLARRTNAKRQSLADFRSAMRYRSFQSYAAPGEKPVTGGVDFFQLFPE
jgi:hypothetical protein